MALQDESMVMPVTPMNGGGGFGGFGNDGWWIILLLLCFGNNGWGNNGGSNGLYPWLNNSNQINDGFRDQMMNTTINGIQNGVISGFGDVQNSLCAGFAGVNASINNGFATSEAAATSRQMANMNQAFGYQMAMNQGFSGIQSQLADCCCRNNLATVQTQNIVQAEGAATRLAIQNQTQEILDKLCAQEIETLRQANINLQNQLNMANLAASQTAQSQYIIDKLTPAA